MPLLLLPRLLRFRHHPSLLAHPVLSMEDGGVLRHNTTKFGLQPFCLFPASLRAHFCIYKRNGLFTLAQFSFPSTDMPFTSLASVSQIYRI
ncbi:uncharacterized protein B0I36DRAFT_324107 [Microdochium trichocladiopsis]|uniref:Uncharacterized protein n=1 Tax=Microdochium trichocladiopsis TaxID=1682393 RepID=A0A9P8Y751_9PEZI|nr:uncharacterized protein B0I36DRAFT_324107 [Microdochium trichocladiopsis]KAH7031541.1 hypothetical protein B0I36DRAFT_324107 [Microdochium trichocladiopsis]